MSAGIRGLPHGTSLPDAAWRRRHSGVLVLLGIHAVGLAVFGVAMGASLLHSVLEGAIIGGVALVAAFPRMSRRARSIVASFGLMSSSAILTHLSGGYIEAHFHFFVMLGIIFLYEDWVPYVLSVGYVAVHHGIAGTLAPESVFNHVGAQESPWLWAGIHALFILGLSAALLVGWNVIDTSRHGQLRAQQEATGLRRQLHAQEKMAALGSLVAGLAHEVRTPLTIVSTNAALIELQTRRLGTDPHATDKVAAHVREIHGSVDRMNALVLQLRRFHRLGGAERKAASLDALVTEAVDLFRAANRTGPPIEVELACPDEALLEPMGVQQLVLNLVANATDAVDPEKGRIVVRTRREGDTPILVVEDNGCGMTRETRERLFEPLFTTKREGMGLGLSIVKRIVDDHGGTIECISERERGTTFRVAFGAEPTARARPVRLDAGASAAPRTA